MLRFNQLVSGADFVNQRKSFGEQIFKNGTKLQNWAIFGLTGFDFNKIERIELGKNDIGFLGYSKISIRLSCTAINLLRYYLGRA